MLLIESHTRMRGQLLAAGKIQLNGWFDGELICSDLFIGPDGYLFGRATARTLTVSGQVVGQALVGTANLNSGSFFEGNLYHTTLCKSSEATLVGEAISTRGALKLPADLLGLEQAANIHGSVSALELQDPTAWPN